jgi:hypothetical protein
LARFRRLSLAKVYGRCVGKESFGHYQLLDVLGRGNREQGLPASTVTVNSVRLG